MNNLTFLIIAIFLSSCTSNNNNEDLARRLDQLEKENKELRETQNSQGDLPESNQPVQNASEKDPTYTAPNPSAFSETNPSQYNLEGKTKYAYVVVKTDEPKLIHTEGIFIRDGVGSFGGTKTNDINFVAWENFVYTIDVEEIKNYNEDKKYKLMDEAEASVRERLIHKDMNFRSEVFMNVDDSDEKRRLQDNSAKILDRKCYVFDSYKQASEHRSKNKGTF